MGLIHDVVQTIEQTCRATADHYRFRQLLESDLATACQAISHDVRTLSPEALDELEELFLIHAIHVVGKPQRLAALRLYAYLKVQETLHYGKFRGFRPLDLT